jgi:hypothetical protein
MEVAPTIHYVMGGVRLEAGTGATTVPGPQPRAPGEVEVTGKLKGVFRLLQGQIRWLGDQDSNLDSQIQSLMAYH